MENDCVAVTVVPERGGKVTSLFDRVNQREWLIQADRELIGPADAHVPYDKGDLCGWDEMVPTISACRYPGGDIVLSDHGELWQRSWSVVAHSTNSISLAVTGSLGYEFERVMSLDAERVVVDYRIVAGVAGLDFLWAAHPFLDLVANTRTKVEGFSGFSEVRSDDGRTPFDWPNDGLSVVEVLAPHTDKKLFAHTASDSVEVVLQDPHGPSLTWSWSATDAPWLGVWLDRASLSPHLVAVVEPTNAGDDSLEVAAGRGDSWTLAGGEEKRWSISVALSDRSRSGDSIARSKEEGTR